MANVLIQESSLENTAASIRKMNGTDKKYTASAFPAAIEALKLMNGSGTDLSGIVYGDGEHISALTNGETGNVLLIREDGSLGWGEPAKQVNTYISPTAPENLAAGDEWLKEVE